MTDDRGALDRIALATLTDDEIAEKARPLGSPAYLVDVLERFGLRRVSDVAIAEGITAVVKAAGLKGVRVTKGRHDTVDIEVGRHAPAAWTACAQIFGFDGSNGFCDRDDFGRIARLYVGYREHQTYAFSDFTYPEGPRLNLDYVVPFIEGVINGLERAKETARRRRSLEPTRRVDLRGLGTELSRRLGIRLTRRQLAKLLGTTVSTLMRWRRGLSAGPRFHARIDELEWMSMHSLRSTLDESGGHPKR